MGKLIKHRSIGKIRMELVDYVLNCTDDELYELCGAVSELKGVTSWSCDECQNDLSQIVALTVTNQDVRSISLR